MGRKILNGVLAGTATLATIYLFGAIGLLLEGRIPGSALADVAAIFGLLVALIVGFVVLQRLPRPADRSAPSSNQDAAQSS